MPEATTVLLTILGSEAPATPEQKKPGGLLPPPPPGMPLPTQAAAPKPADAPPAFAVSDLQILGHEPR